MNPMDMMQIVGRISIFKKQHPKFGMFLSSISQNGVKKGDILEIKYKAEDGRESVANIKLTDDDIETLNMLKNMRNNQ